MKTGTLYGIGVGPSDPELLSLKAVKYIKTAQLIAYPTNKQGVSFAREIASPYIDNDAQEFGFYIPMKTDRSAANIEYDKAATHIEAHLTNGKNVACLCEGDSLFYGSFSYILERLQPKFNVEIIPAIPAFVAAGAALSQPIVMQNEDLQIIPATLNANILATKIKNSDNISIYKVGRHFAKLHNILCQQNLLDKAHLIEYVSNEKQKITPMLQTDSSTRPYFSMIIINKR